MGREGTREYVWIQISMVGLWLQGEVERRTRDEDSTDVGKRKNQDVAIVT